MACAVAVARAKSLEIITLGRTFAVALRWPMFAATACAWATPRAVNGAASQPPKRLLLLFSASPWRTSHIVVRVGAGRLEPVTDSWYTKHPMPDYSKLHDLISHRVTFEYDTGARVTGYLASCQPSTGAVEFVVLSDVKLTDSKGKVVREAGELTICPNALTGIARDEGPRGRDHR